MKKRLFNAVSLWGALAGLLILVACPQEPGREGNVDTGDLQLKITEAESERDGTRVSADGTDVPLGIFWVTSPVRETFDAAIATAETVLLTARSQAAVNTAAANLESAITVFRTAKQAGTAAPIDMTALAAKIAEAESEKDLVVVDTAAANVPLGRYWVTASVMGTFQAAIDAAIGVRNTAMNQQAVYAATGVLDAAITAFKGERYTGTKNAGFTSEELAELVAEAIAAKQGVQTSAANGDDIGPVDFWVSQGDLASLDSAISAAQNATGNVDAPYLALVAAINAFSSAKHHGTTPDKTALTQAIESADQAKAQVLVAASAAQAPIGSSWATAEQWSPFDTAYASAVAALSNSNASKNAVDGAASALAAATGVFSAAVQANGPGENTASVTINGLPYDDGMQIRLYLFSTDENINIINSSSGIDGGGIIQNGTVTVSLAEYPSNTPWHGTGSWYVVLYTQYGAVSITTAAVDFSANPNPVMDFSSFRPYVFSYRLGDLFDGVFEDVSQMTLDEWFTEVGGFTYTEYVSIYSAPFYKTEALTQPFVGSDIVYATTVIYTQAMIGGGNQGEKIGDITGTITLTGISSPPQMVYINVEGNAGNNWWNSSNRINMSSVSGTTATLNWSIPVYENTGFVPSTGRFELSVRPAGSSFNSGTYRVSIQAQPNIPNENADVGDLGTVSIQSVTLSGTLNVTHNGTTVPYVRIVAYKAQWGSVGSASISSPGANAPWSITVGAFDASTEIQFRIEGFSSTQANWENRLFQKEVSPASAVFAHNQDVPGINLNAGNIATVTLSGTLSVTYNGSPVPYVQIDAYAEQGGNFGNWLSSTSLYLPGANAPWSITLEAFNSSTEIEFRVRGYLNTQGNSGSVIFVKRSSPVPVHNQDVPGISLSFGNIVPVTLSGTINVTYNGNIVPYVRIEANANQLGSLGSTWVTSPVANAQWSMTVGSFDVPTEIGFVVFGYAQPDQVGQLIYGTPVSLNPPVSVQNQPVTGIVLNVAATGP